MNNESPHDNGTSSHEQPISERAFSDIKASPHHTKRRRRIRLLILLACAILLGAGSLVGYRTFSENITPAQEDEQPSATQETESLSQTEPTNSGPTSLVYVHAEKTASQAIIYSRPISGGDRKELGKISSITRLSANRAFDNTTPTGNQFAFMVDGQTLWTGAFNDTPKQIYSFASTAQSQATISPDGRYIAYTTQQNAEAPTSVALFDTQTSKVSSTENAIASSIQFLGWSNTGSLFYMAIDSDNASISLIREGTNKKLTELSTTLLEGVAISPDGSHIAYAQRTPEGGTSDIIVFDVETLKASAIATVTRTGNSIALQWLHDESEKLLYENEHTIKKYDTKLESTADFYILAAGEKIQSIIHATSDELLVGLPAETGIYLDYLKPSTGERTRMMQTGTLTQPLGILLNQ